MELTFQAATPAERLYSVSQSMQLKGQTGCVGHLRAGTGMDVQGFLKTWQSHRQDLDTEEFQMEFEGVLNALVGDEQYGGFLKSRDAMRDFCQQHPENGFDDGFAFGFRADTAQYSYLIRLNPYKEEENLSLYCYRRDWLDQHMKRAEQGIRFITSHYEEKFRIADGDSVRIRCPDGRQLDRECRYIDEYHVEVGKGWDNLYHICQFAELMERNGNSVIPLRSSLPLVCYGKVPEKRAIVMFERGFDGYHSASAVTRGRTSQKLVEQLNSGMGVSKAQAAAMLAGATQGWATPAADPKNYDEQGQPIKPRRPDRGDAR
ncbi:hypothetical protein D1646_14420 [Pseudoflavonifractor sp. 60]|uniref:hypothetical protein n=1 Tax=Pseudoflavonifractor sp. 60 TaxID=2304576 RepID=UPI00136E6AC9|nr:hypothetical protein [Pseudoflavonifractor sp. 60]NBI67975.1 hypothetical protein [Pseudoflavonifractor sp. 60]